MNRKVFRCSMFRLMLGCMMLMTFSSCSLFNRYHPSPEVQSAVVHVADDYLRFIAMGRRQQVEAMMLMAPYLVEKEMSKDQWRKQFASIQNRWPKDDHPLLQLILTELDVRENTAKLRLKKPSMPEMPEVEIRMEWAGSGWLISSDTLFGSSGVLEYLLKNAPQKQS